MAHRKLEYRFLPRQGESVGFCSLVHPFLSLWEQTKARFLCDAVRLVAQGNSFAHLGDLLESCGFGQATFSLDEWFQNYQAQPLQLALDCPSLRKLGDTAEDLTRDGGMWKENASDLNGAEQDALAEIEARLKRLVGDASTRFGPGAVRKVLAEVRRRFDDESQKWSTAASWTKRLSEELLQAAQTVRAYAGPRKLIAKVLLRARPGLQATWWLTEGQSRNLSRKLFPQILKAHQLRFLQEVERRKRNIAETLLGRPGIQGLLDRFLAESLAHEEFFQNLESALTTNAVANHEIAESNRLCTANSLDVVLDARRNRTVGDLYGEAVAGAGCSPTDFAAKLTGQGLLIHGREHKPAEWTHLRPRQVAEALHRQADQYLGSMDQNAQLPIDSPRTAFESAAAITPAHPELEPLVKNLLPTLVTRSRPYVEAGGVTQGEPKIHAFLYCYPGDRRRWQRYLQTQVTLVNASVDAEKARAYRIKHPYAMTLIQFAVEAPLGALKTLPSWAHQGNLLSRNGGTPFFDHTTAPETRRLAQRPQDYQDSQQLFEAACKARVIAVLSRTVPVRYAPVTTDSVTEDVFAPPQYAPEWKDEDYFLKALGRTGFTRSLELAFPNVPDLGPKLVRFAHEDDANHVAGALTSLGILEANATGHHFRVHWHGKAPGVLPLELFHKQKGTLQGLASNECVAELHRNDDFYNAVFWQICDALDMGRVSPNDVPASLLTVVKSL